MTCKKEQSIIENMIALWGNKMYATLDLNTNVDELQKLPIKDALAWGFMSCPLRTQFEVSYKN